MTKNIYVHQEVDVSPETLADNLYKIGYREGIHSVKWSRYGGYECSSKGDKRFSAFFAKLEDGRTIEQHYQCDVKGYDPGGTNWKLGKGKPPIKEVNLWEEYLVLWQKWAAVNEPLIEELRVACNGHLSDRFATSDINQAAALAHILNN